MSIASVVGAALITVLGTGCVTRNVPLTNIEVPLPTVPIPGLPILGPGQDDLRFMRWERAFEKMHGRLSTEYPYTEWKGINWDALDAEFAPRVRAAQKADDADAWYTTLADYVARIPDDKVSISPRPGDGGNEGEDAAEDEDDFFDSLLEEPLAFSTDVDGRGQVQIRYFAPSLSMPFPGRAFSRGLAEFIEAGATAITIDLRGCNGGTEKLAAEFAGHFTAWEDEASPILVKYAEFSRREEAFVTRQIFPVNPVEPFVDLPTTVLVDSETGGVAELFAHYLQQRGASIVGTSPSRGSVGAPGGELTLPKGHSITYPTGRALDASGQIIIERNAENDGGVNTDTLVPTDGDVSAQTTAALVSITAR